jgi:DNA-binding response OmpR family regulator
VKVMIADDDRARVRMVPNYLEQRGFQTTPVFDGMPTVMFSHRAMPDVILLDFSKLNEKLWSKSLPMAPTITLD